MSKTLIAIPAHDMMHTYTTRCLVGLAIPAGTPFSFAIGTLVFDARNQLVDDAFRNGCDRILFIDSDMIFDSDTYIRLNEDMNESGADVVCGIFTTRKHPIEPTIYSKLSWHMDENGMMKIDKVCYEDYPLDSLFEVEGCGFACTLVKTELCEKILGTYGAPFTPMPGLGEDLTFCVKTREVGGKIMCDSRIKIDHIGLATYGEQDFQYFKSIKQEAQKDEQSTR